MAFSGPFFTLNSVALGYPPVTQRLELLTLVSASATESSKPA